MKSNKKDEFSELKSKTYEVLDEFKRIICKNIDKIPSFYDINKLNMDHISLVEEFGNLIIEYEIDHNQIAELILNHIKKYVVHDESQEQDKSINDTDSEDELKEVVARKARVKKN